MKYVIVFFDKFKLKKLFLFGFCLLSLTLSEYSFSQNIVGKDIVKVSPEFYVRFTMFIPMDHVTMPLFALGNLDSAFEGDNRLFVGELGEVSNGLYYDESGKSEEYGGPTYRVMQSFRVQFGNDDIFEHTAVSGTTRRFNIETSMTTYVGGEPLFCTRKNCGNCTPYSQINPMHVPGACISETAKNDTFPTMIGEEDDEELEEFGVSDMSSVKATVIESSLNSIKIHVRGNPSNAVVNWGPTFLVPSITWNFNMELFILPDNEVGWKLEGTRINKRGHDSFPAYEFEVNKKVIYQWDPIPNGSNPLGLGSIIVNVVLDEEGTL